MAESPEAKGFFALVSQASRIRSHGPTELDEAQSTSFIDAARNDGFGLGKVDPIATSRQPRRTHAGART